MSICGKLLLGEKATFRVQYFCHFQYSGIDAFYKFDSYSLQNQSCWTRNLMNAAEEQNMGGAETD